MEVKSALDLVNAIIYKPGWRISAEDHTRRFEGAIVVRIDYPARASERDEAPDYEREINTYATFPLIVADCDDVGIYRRIVDKLIAIETHEIREFFRIQPTRWAPFHPHRIDGMKRWGDPDGDLQFGIA
ncbi:hypothetical protein [Micromonospora sp. 4G55]|uniref:hypothetical protein n=1 Tax=Micromonospora sp. 4G55 TaxID=2806102 RepID=UPI001A3BA366|nr:hypothetical protein [Micromonospora sp. 4G55]MBM0256376.1 hypothetical protein [Micromonospora sp. 4G55]